MRLLNLKFLMTLFFLLHVVSNFSFNALTILQVEVSKIFLQYFQNTMLGSIVEIFSLLLKYSKGYIVI